MGQWGRQWQGDSGIVRQWDRGQWGSEIVKQQGNEIVGQRNSGIVRQWDREAVGQWDSEAGAVGSGIMRQW